MVKISEYVSQDVENFELNRSLKPVLEDIARDISSGTGVSGLSVVREDLRDWGYRPFFLIVRSKIPLLNTSLPLALEQQYGVKNNTLVDYFLGADAQVLVSGKRELSVLLYDPRVEYIAKDRLKSFSEEHGIDEMVLTKYY